MKSKLNQIWMLWQCIIFLGLITSVKLDKCEKTDKCTVETNQEAELCTFLCKNDGIEVKLFPNQVIISCKNYDKSDYLQWIENLNKNSIAGNIEEVEIQQCAVFNGSYNEIFKAFKTKPIKKFTLSIGKHNDSHSIILEPRHFANLDLLTDLRIVNSDITVLPEQLFKNMINLEALSLYNTSLQNLTGKIFDPLKKLKYLDLNNANLTRLDENIFHPLSNLTVLKMENNGLDNLSRTLFSSLNQLTDLELGGNMMTTLADGIFDNLKNLVNVSLGDNNLTGVPKNLFFNNSNLERIKLNNTFNKENFTLPPGFLANLKSLKILNLGGNGLTSLPEGLFNNTTDLQELYIDRNNLSLALDRFKRLNNLMILELSFNEFKILTTQDFNHFNTSLNRTINLGDNKIKTIDLNLTELHKYQNDSSRTVVEFKIAKNPIDCNCEALHLAQYIRDESNKSIRIMPDGVFCHTPNTLQNTSLKDVDLKELKCSIVENCPKVAEQNCTCNYRPVDTTIEVNCSSTGINVFPQQLPIYNTSNNSNTTHCYELLFANNDITSMQGLNNLSEHFNITKINLSYNKLENIEDITRLKALQVLELDHNHLKYLNNQTIDLLRSTANLRSITLHGNPWVCNCDTKYLLDFIHHPGKIKIPNDQNIKCDKNGDSITNLTEDELCSTSSLSRTTLYILAILVLLGAAAIWYYKGEIRIYILRSPRLRWLVMKWKRKVDQDGTYNPFFDQSNSQENLNFVGSGGRERQPLIEL